MTAADIDHLVEVWASAARRAIEAGFTVIELHFAHGYLVHQFLSPLANSRVDAHGGPLENRARLAVAIARAVRNGIGEGLVVFARLSVVDWADGGLTLDESVEIAMLLKDAGVDVIDCSSGAVVDGEVVPVEPLYQVGFAARIRRDAGIRTAAVGLIREPDDAEAVIQEGDADFVLLGRAFLQDAYWPRRAGRHLTGRESEPRIPVPYRRSVEKMPVLSQW